MQIMTTMVGSILKGRDVSWNYHLFDWILARKHPEMAFQGEHYRAAGHICAILFACTVH